MKSEAQQSLRPSWVAFGWFAAAAMTGLALVVMISVGLLPRDSSRGGEGWALLAVALGFLSGGWLVGWRTGSAPVLHGVAIGAFSIVAWLFLNLLSETLGLAAWTGLGPIATGVVLVVQTLAAIAGAWYGTRHHAVGA